MTEFRECVARALGEYTTDAAWNFAGQDARDYWLEQADNALRLITEECAKVAANYASDRDLAGYSDAEMEAFLFGVMDSGSSIASRIRQLAGDK